MMAAEPWGMSVSKSRGRSPCDAGRIASATPSERSAMARYKALSRRCMKFLGGSTIRDRKLCASVRHGAASCSRVPARRSNPLGLGAMRGCRLAQSVRLGLFLGRLLPPPLVRRPPSPAPGPRSSRPRFDAPWRGLPVRRRGPRSPVVLPYDLPHPLAAAIVGVGCEGNPRLGHGRQPIVVAVDESIVASVVLPFGS